MVGVIGPDNFNIQYPGGYEKMVTLAKIKQQKKNVKDPTSL